MRYNILISRSNYSTKIIVFSLPISSYQNYNYRLIMFNYFYFVVAQTPQTTFPAKNHTKKALAQSARAFQIGGEIGI